MKELIIIGTILFCTLIYFNSKKSWLLTLVLCAIMVATSCILSGCATAKVVHKRPNLRRIEAQVFTDEKNKLYIYIP